MKKWKRWIRFIVSIIILGICIWFSVDLMNKDTVTYEVYVSQCIDGDTAVFKNQDESFVARFLAVNAPEVDTNEYYAQEAKDYSCQLLRNAHTIVVEEEPTEIEVPYGMTKTEISAFLSDLTGFCHKSFKVAYVN